MFQTTTRTPVHPVINDVVAPARLFEIARIRFDGARNTLRQPGLLRAPTALAAVITIGQISSGINALDSVLVPSTGFELRRRAASAIDRARESVALLRAYHEVVIPFGDTSRPTSALPPAAGVMLREAISQLTMAVAELR
jgi:hypothetical protein